jgi:unsaturated rhamnogalacturonyl hydrolase
LINILNIVAEGVQKYQDPATGVWWQVMDKGGAEGNYIEATCSAMFTYFLLKAVKHNYIENAYLSVAKAGYQGILDSFIEVEENGLVNLTNCCSVAGLGGEPYRMGTYEYYLSEPIRNNDAKGVGPFIMASMLYDEIVKK